MEVITVIKLDLAGEPMRRYSGTLVRRDSHSIVLQAPFVIDKPEWRLLDVILRRGDLFVETYYDDRGYNIYEIFDRDDASFKGWYCNLSRPAQIGADVVTWVDLALDLWVWPDGRSQVMDQDEFEALPIDAAEREQVMLSLARLRRQMENTQPPS